MEKKDLWYTVPPSLFRNNAFQKKRR